MTVVQNTPAGPLLTASEVATRLNVSRPTVYRLAEAGLLPGVMRVGSQWRFDAGRLEAWLSGNEQDARKGPE
jgi:excisionase family DNA binding protein